MKIQDFEKGLNYINQVLHEYGKEDDRAATILAAAELDSHLLQLLSLSLLPPVKDTSSPLLGRGEALESFGARIELAFRIGLIPPVFHHDLHQIRKIRNEFAHGRSGLSFKQGKPAKLAAKLITGRKTLEHLCAKSHKDGKHQCGTFSNRKIFQMTCSILLPHIFILATQAQPMTPRWPQIFKDSKKTPDSL